MPRARIITPHRTMSIQGTLDEWQQPVYDSRTELLTFRAVQAPGKELVVSLSKGEIVQILNCLPEGII